MTLFLHVLGWATAALNAALALAVLSSLTGASVWRATLRPLIRENARILILILSLGAATLTLVMEHVFGLAPCVLCWWQRIFMYPIAVIAVISVVKHTDVSDIADYVLALSFIGGAIAFYQHLLQMLPQGSLLPCDAANECAVRSVFELGYITLPWMAVSLFAVLFFIAFVARKR